MTTAGEGVRVGRLQPHEVDQNFRLLADALMCSGQLLGQKVYGGVNAGETLELYSESAAKSYFAKFGTGGKLSLGTNATERLAIDANGFITVPGMHDVTGNTSTAQSLASGTYTPTYASVANIAVISPRAARWMRVGNVVTVEGAVDVDPTAATTLTTYGISLPVVSNLAVIPDLAGTVAYRTSANTIVSGMASADTANDRAQVDFVSDAAADSRTHRFLFTYVVL